MTSSGSAGPQGETLRCVACGRAVPAGNPTCSACGEPVRPSERKLITLLFADLAGYTTLAGALDPEEVFAFLRPTMTELRLIVEQHGGSVPQVMGDGFMAVFGAPVSHEDDAERAVRAALALVAHAPRAKANRRAHFRSPNVHIGVNTGEVMVAPSREASGFAVVGDAVNVAARLADLAAEGHVFVGDRTQELTRHAIRYGPRRVRRVKGKPGGIICFEALVALSPMPVVHVAPGGRSPFVGRRGPLRYLSAALRDVGQHHNSKIVLVTGEPGLGKSRLASEFAQRSHGALALWGTCHPYGQELPLSALAEALRMAASIPPDAAMAWGRRLLNDFVAGLVGPNEATALSGRLAPHLGLEARPSGAVSGLDEATVAIRTVLRGLAAERPVLVTLDDVHWAQPELLELLGSVHREPWEGTILFLLLGRPEVGAMLPGVPRIELPVLPEAETARLARAAFGGPLPETIIERLVARAGGNPLFLEESARVLVESGAVVPDDGRWRIVDGAATERVPATIRLLITARIDGLDVEEKGILRDAAVAGQRFWSDLLERFSGGPVEATLSRLEARDLVRRRPSSRFRGSAEFEFKHELIRDVAYESMPRLERAARHRTIADWLEARPGEPPVALLAHHWTQAWQFSASRTGPPADLESARRAATYHARWGQQTFGHSPRLATALYEQGLRLAEAANGKQDRQLVAQLLVGKAQGLIELGRHEEAIASAARARTLAVAAEDNRLKASAFLALGRAHSDLGDVRRARGLLRQALPLFESAGDPSGQARTLHRLAETYRFDNFRREVELYEHAQELYARSGERWERAMLALDLAYLLTVVGGSLFRQKLAQAERLSEVAGPRGRAALLRTRAYHAYYAGDYGEALQLIRRAGPMAIEAGDRWTEVDALLLEALILGAIGPPAQAEWLARHVRGIAHDVGARHLEGLSLLAAVLPALRLGHPNRAVRLLRESRDALGGLGVDAEMAEVDLVEAWLLLERGLWRAVERPARAAEVRARRNGWTLLQLQAVIVRGLAALGAGRQRQGRTQLAAALAEARASDAKGMAAIASAALRELRLLAGQEAVARPTLEENGNPRVEALAAEASALTSVRAGDDFSAASDRAVTAWSRLGLTAWLARALALRARMLRGQGSDWAAEEFAAQAREVLRVLRAPADAVEGLGLP